MMSQFGLSIEASALAVLTVPLLCATLNKRFFVDMLSGHQSTLMMDNCFCLVSWRVQFCARLQTVELACVALDTVGK